MHFGSLPLFQVYLAICRTKQELIKKLWKHQYIKTEQGYIRKVRDGDKFGLYFVIQTVGQVDRKTGGWGDRLTDG